MDLYALLGLQNERWTATDAQIKLGTPPQSASLLSVMDATHLWSHVAVPLVHPWQAHSQQMLGP